MLDDLIQEIQEQKQQLAALQASFSIVDNARQQAELALQQCEEKYRHSENKLKESEVQYNNLINAGSALIWISDNEKLCTFFNNNWLKFTGRTLEQEIGNGWAQGVHTDDFDRCLDIYNTSFDKRKSFEMEYRLHHASGEYRWILDLGTPNYNSAGTFIGYMGHCFDISEIKNTETELKSALNKQNEFNLDLEKQVSERIELLDLSNQSLKKENIEREKSATALRLSEADNHAIIKAVPDLMFRIHRDGTFLDVISQNEASLYVPQDAFIGKKLSEVLPPYLALQSSQSIEQAFSTRDLVQFEYQLTVQNKDSYYENRISVISENEVLSIVRDITQRKEAEVALQMQTAAFESFSAAIIITNVDGYIQWTNSAFTQLTGYTIDEFIGERLGDIVKSGIQDSDFYKILWDTILNKKVWKGELINRRKDGTHYFEEQTITPVLNSQGNICNFIAIKTDITERKKIEEDLRESKEKYRGLSEASFEAIFFSINGVCIEQNLAAEKMFGYTTEEALTRYGTEWIVPEDRKMVMDNMLSGTEKPYEATALRKDGTTFPCVLRGNMMYYKNTQVRVTSLTDISERKEVENALMESELRFSLFMDYLPAVVFLKDNEGRTLFVNNYSTEIFGANNWVGKTNKEIFPNELAERLTLDDKNSMALGYIKIEESMTHLNGEIHQYETQKFTIICPGQKPMLGGISLDITDRKKTEKEIIKVKESLAKQVEIRTSELVIAKNKAEESEQLYRLLIESIPNTSFLLFDKNLRYIIAGGSKPENTDYNKYLLIGKTIQEVFPKEIVDLYEPYYLKALNGESSGFEINQENFVYFQQVLPVYNLQNEIFAGIVIAQNISESKQAEKSAIASQRLMAMGEMASSVAHDFNNSLQALQGNIEVLKNKEYFSNSSLKYFHIIDGIISDVADRVKSLQRFGDSKQNNYESKLADLNNIISEVISQLRPIWKDKIEKDGFKINIHTEYYDNLILNCNEGELKTVYYNILKNSIESMHKGGNIIIESGKKDNKAFVTIEDTGVGMDEETKLKVFQPFFTTKGFEAGRGLGMSGVYSVIKSHGGDVFVKFSEPGKGTIIETVFPYNREDEIKGENKKIEQAINSKVKLNVLWVEDDDTIRQTVAEMVSLLGHKCDTANSGKIALEYIEKNTYDIVFTDIGMPEINGWQLANTIKEKFKGKLVVVIVSGWAISEQEKNEYGIKYVLGKPFKLVDLKKIFSNFPTINLKS